MYRNAPDSSASNRRAQLLDSPAASAPPQRVQSKRLFYPLSPPSLMFGAPDHPAEAEADRVAERVMQRLDRNEAGVVAGAEPVTHYDDRNSPVVRRHAAANSNASASFPASPVSGRTSEAGAIPVDAHRRLTRARDASGFALPSHLQTSFGRALGSRARAARLHHDDASDRLARQFDADAFSLGGDVFFRRGAYAPGTSRGKWLLAHELTHVAQDGGRGRVLRRMMRRRLLPPDPISSAVSAAGGELLSSPLARFSRRQIWTKVRENGVLQFQGGQRKPRGYEWIDDDQAPRFANAGLRSPESLFVHKDTGAQYEERNGQYFHKETGALARVPNSAALLDFSRKDRDDDDIALNDVTSYRQAKKNEKAGDQMEHDHVPSGESARRRVGGAQAAQTKAYNNALAIEIRGKNHPEGADHQERSPTYGGRQKYRDQEPRGRQLPRPDFDAEFPEAAFYRDATTMLNATSDSALRKQRGDEDRLLQLGAYRNLYAQQVRAGVLDPSAPGMVAAGDPLVGGLRWKFSPETAGRQTAQKFMQYVRDEITPYQKNQPVQQPPPRSRKGRSRNKHLQK